MDQLPEIKTDDFLKFLLLHGYSEEANDQGYIYLKNESIYAQPSRLGSKYITIANRENIGGKTLESVLKQAAIQIETFIDDYRSTIALEVDKSIVAYLDILGFSKKIQDASRDPGDLNRFLEHFYNTNKTAFKRIHDFTSRQKQFDIFKSSHVRYFSDNLVLIQECASIDHEESEIARVLIEIAHYQSELAMCDLFSRGAITLGDTYCDNKFIFGLPIVKAHYLEDCIAEVPRIILDVDLKDRLVQIASYYYGIQCIFSDLVIQDCDGEWFINYLLTIRWTNDLCIENPSPEDENLLRYQKYHPIAIQRLTEHKENIIRNLGKVKGEDLRIRKKYEWLAQYHNHFCSHYFTGESSLLIENIGELHRFSHPIWELLDERIRNLNNCR